MAVITCESNSVLPMAPQSTVSGGLCHKFPGVQYGLSMLEMRNCHVVETALLLEKLQRSQEGAVMTVVYSLCIQECCLIGPFDINFPTLAMRVVAMLDMSPACPLPMISFLLLPWSTYTEHHQPLGARLCAGSVQCSLRTLGQRSWSSPAREHGFWKEHCWAMPPFISLEGHDGLWEGVGWGWAKVQPRQSWEKVPSWQHHQETSNLEETETEG